MLQRLENTRAEHHELVVQTLLRIRNLPKEEMQALAEGALRVLHGEAQAETY